MGRTATTTVIILCTAGMLLAGPVGSVAAQEVTLTITVVDQNGSPVSDVSLNATWADGASTATTRSNGQAFIDVEEGADVTIRIDHPVYTRNVPYELSDASSGSHEIDVARKADATVTVRDSSGPLKGARVALRRDGRAIAVGTTDANGRFSSGTIEAGDYTLSVLEEGYYRRSMPISISDGATREVKLEPGTVSVTFNVLDRNFDPAKPVAGATITGATIGSMKTQQNGVQQASVPVNTEVDVTVTKDGYRTVEKTITLEESDVNVNISTRKKETISFEFLNDRVVAGEQVLVEVTGTYGDPVEEATVFLDGEQVGTTDERGVVTVTIDSAGEHSLYAKSGSMSTAERTVVGVEPMSTTSTSQATPGPAEPADQAALMAIPGVGQRIHLRSVGIGAAIGVVLMLVLIGYGRFRSMSRGE